MSRAVCGRFAPSPTGPLHAGSLVAAVASWLDARAHGGRWLVRIEDVDTPRCDASVARAILQQLHQCGLVSDDVELWQSQRGDVYQAALDSLRAAGRVFDCACSRSDIAAARRALGDAVDQGQVPQRFAELVYPGTCRSGLHGRPARAVRFRVDAGVVRWHDRRAGAQRQDVAREVGDFVLKRADGLWAYQLAVVVDDAAQGITHVVRGQDLADNTARQVLLQRALGLPTPLYLHTPLVLAADGHKLSKQNGARPLDLSNPVAALQAAGQVLGLPSLAAGSAQDWLLQAVGHWSASLGQ